MPLSQRNLQNTASVGRCPNCDFQLTVSVTVEAAEPVFKAKRGKRLVKISKAGLKSISDAQSKRWAKFHQEKARREQDVVTAARSGSVAADTTNSGVEGMEKKDGL